MSLLFYQVCSNMKITTIKSQGLAALSYYVSSNDEAFVIDPRRDAEVYYELAREENAKIRYIFETHRNEDFVTGSLELKEMVPDAEICHSDQTSFGFGDQSLSDDEEIEVDGMKVRCMNTPGHTFDSMCYVISDLSIGQDPAVVFTGDTLFVNEVGRTDLVDKKKHEELSRHLYHSLHSKLLPLGHGLIVHPAHGAGSVCGGSIADRDFTTLGYECNNNKWLSMDEDEFVEAKLAQGLTLAPYFKHCEKLNTKGPPLLSSYDEPIELLPERIEELVEKKKQTIVDTRPSHDFIRIHIPGTISLSLSSIGLLAGWALKPNDTHSLVLESPDDLSKARNYLVRIGFDRILGYLLGGIDAWISSERSTGSLKKYESGDLRKLTMVDVREPHEFEEGRIEGSKSFPLTSIRDADVSKLSKKKVGTICPSGIRSTTGASILEMKGVESVGVYTGGLKLWKSEGRVLVGEE
jgi:hydroxyacylglutathione hydrolase